MISKIKKITCLLLCLCMMLSLSVCNKSKTISTNLCNNTSQITPHEIDDWKKISV